MALTTVHELLEQAQDNPGLPPAASGWQSLIHPEDGQPTNMLTHSATGARLYMQHDGKRDVLRACDPHYLPQFARLPIQDTLEPSPSAGWDRARGAAGFAQALVKITPPALLYFEQGCRQYHAAANSLQDAEEAIGHLRDLGLVTQPTNKTEGRTARLSFTYGNVEAFEGQDTPGISIRIDLSPFSLPERQAIELLSFLKGLRAVQ